MQNSKCKPHVARRAGVNVATAITDAAAKHVGLHFAFEFCITREEASRRRSSGRSGAGPPGVTFTAQYLNSGILPNGSSTGLVSRFAAAS